MTSKKVVCVIAVAAVAVLVVLAIAAAVATAVVLTRDSDDSNGDTGSHNYKRILLQRVQWTARELTQDRLTDSFESRLHAYITSY